MKKNRVYEIEDKHQRNVELNKDNSSKVRLKWGVVDGIEEVLYDYTMF